MSQHQNHWRASFWNWAHKLTSFFGCFVGAPWWLYVWVLAPCHPLRELSPKRLLRMTDMAEPFEQGLCDNGTNEGRVPPVLDPGTPQSGRGHWATGHGQMAHSKGGKLPPRLKQRDSGTCAKGGAPPRTHAAIDAFDNTEIKPCHIMDIISDTALNPSNLATSLQLQN